MRRKVKTKFFILISLKYFLSFVYQCNHLGIYSILAYFTFRQKKKQNNLSPWTHCHCLLHMCCYCTHSLHWREANARFWALPALVFHFLVETLQFAAVATELNCKSLPYFCLPKGLSATALSATSVSSQKAEWELHLLSADQALNILEVQKPLNLSCWACFQVRHYMSCPRPVS